MIQALLREIGAGRPGLFTHVGLGSFVDPRNGGGKSNECTTDDLVELIEIDGETKLRYRPFKVDYAILRGTYADPRGNVSLEEEAIDMDSYSMALAAHNSGGKVFVQVRDVLEAGAIEPRRVKLPGILVDGIVEHREQPQTYLGGYDLTISGQHRRLSSNDAIELVSHPVRRLIARRAARELVAGASTNFGFGIPGGIPGVALREGVPYQSLWLSVEQGVHNGMMLDDAFSAAPATPMPLFHHSINLSSTVAEGSISPSSAWERWISTVTSTYPISMAISLVPAVFSKLRKMPVKWCSAARSTLKAARSI